MRLIVGRLQTYLRLGSWNLMAVAYYRWQLKSGHFKKTLPIVGWSSQSASALFPSADNYPIAEAPFSVRFFNDNTIEVASPPDWVANPYSNSRLAENLAHWSEMPDFDLKTGDVKTLWELSRFDWLIKACWQIRDTGEAPLPLNDWLDNWCELNPVNQGVNWKCAQEASIRAMNMVLAHSILCPEARVTNQRLIEFLVEHVNRILPTINYARAQDNNHGTSEAAALFIVGTVLHEFDDQRIKAVAAEAVRCGRRCLEERAEKLIGLDGVFSQYSVNYHRMMLDTLSFAELIRRHYGSPSFSSGFLKKAGKATQWLIAVTDPMSGDAPNMGANDGSQLFNVKDTNFRDFRPSCQLAGSLFLGRCVMEDHMHGLSELFLQNQSDDSLLAKSDEVSTQLNSGALSAVSPVLTEGFKRIGSEFTYAILKVPHNRFRPSQADALHIDVWHNGVNLIRDAGTYSYNPPENFCSDFGDTRHHSTVELDGRNQMDKLSRFLYKDWLSPRTTRGDHSNSEEEFPEIQGAYVDSAAGAHSRSVSFDGEIFTIVDNVRGCKKSAKLRYRLAPCSWVQDDLMVSSDFMTISVNGSGVKSAALIQGLESRCYLELSDVPVFEVLLSGESVITTTLQLAKISE